MAKNVTRRQLLAAAAPLAVAAPFVKLAAGGGEARAAPHAQHDPDKHGFVGHAAMIGPEVPAPGEPDALDALTIPPAALPHQPGRVREYTLRAVDRDIEIINGVTF